MNMRRARNEDVRREIENFLQALRSYPTRFSKNPDLSFDDHRRGMNRGLKLQVIKPEDRRRA